MKNILKSLLRMSGREVTNRVRGGAAGAADTGIALSKVSTGCKQYSYLRVWGVSSSSEYRVYQQSEWCIINNVDLTI